MKHSICGFNHYALGMTFKLDYTDAQIIRSIVDFRDTGKMKSVRVEGREFFWISYTWLLDELPFCGIGSQKVVGRRFAKYVDCGLMERYIESGNKTYYRFNEESINELVSFPQYEKRGTQMEGEVLKSARPELKSSATPELQSSTIDPSTSNPSTTTENSNPALTVFTHWNSKSPIKHRCMSKEMETYISDRITTHGVEELKQCIDNYVAVVTNAASWYTYQSALDDFLRPGKRKSAPCEKFFAERFVLKNFLDKKKINQESGIAWTE